MLGVNHYEKEYVDHCRSRVDEQLAAYKKLAKAVANGTGDPKSTSALESFEPLFFNNLVLVLDHSFVHRLRTMEGKDGNPLNEVRVLCESLLNNNGLLGADKQIKLTPERSILKLKVGDPIRLKEQDFRRLASAFFDEIERKYA